jgi:hypothetical protein
MSSNAAYEKSFSTARRAVSTVLVVGLLVLAGTASAGRGGGGGGRIKADKAPPSIAISSPAEGAMTNATISVAGAASDNVQVASVAVSVDGGPYQAAQGTTSWSYSLDTTRYANGSHTVNALAADAAGNTSTTSVGFAVMNATTQQSVTISAPVDGATIGGTVSVSGTASDPDGVASVALSVDDGPSAPASGTTAWTGALDTTTLANGPHTLKATALDAGGKSSSASVAVNVQNADSSPPSVSISSPAPGTTLSGTVTVSGTASDNVQVASVAISVDGGAYQTAQGNTSWSYTLVTASYSNGGHNLSARVTDAAGNVSSASVAVTIQNSLPSGIAQQLVTPEGATIQIASDVSGWTAQQVYDLLKPNALELTRVGPSLTVKVQTQYSSQTTTGVSQSGGVYSNYRATIYLQATGSSVFTSRPDYIIAHEYGHAWTMYHLFISHSGNWTSYLQARGILGDPRVDSTFNWSKNEMIADDYRMLFGTPAAISESFYINSDVPDPRNVAGLRDFFLNVWAAP